MRGLTGGRRRAKNSMTNLFIRECLRVFPESTNSLHRPFSFHFRSFNVNGRIKSIECFSLFFFRNHGGGECSLEIVLRSSVRRCKEAKDDETTIEQKNSATASFSFFFFLLLDERDVICNMDTGRNRKQCKQLKNETYSGDGRRGEEHGMRDHEESMARVERRPLN